MEKYLYVTLTLTNSICDVRVIEKNNSNFVEMYSKQDNVKKLKELISVSMKEIQELIGGKVSNISVVIKHNKNFKQQSFVKKHEIDIIDNKISSEDISNLMKDIELKYENDISHINSIVPVKFITYFEDEIKNYSVAPINKNANKLEVYVSIKKIDMNIYKYIHSTLKECGLNLSNILLESTTKSFAKISNDGMDKGTLLIDVDNDYLNIVLNNNGMTIDSAQTYNLGISSLKSTLRKTLGYSENKIEYMLTSELETKDIGELEIMIKLFVNKIYDNFNDYLEKNKIKNMPIVIDIHQLKNELFMKIFDEVFSSKDISYYKPMDFIEANSYNHNNIGLIRYSEKQKNVLNLNKHMIIYTEPGTINNSKTKVKKSLIMNILKKLGV